MQPMFIIFVHVDGTLIEQAQNWTPTLCASHQFYSLPLSK